MRFVRQGPISAEAADDSGEAGRLAPADGDGEGGDEEGGAEGQAADPV